MGWASGSELLEKVIEVVPPQSLAQARALVDAFADQDCDTLDEVAGLNEYVDQALRDVGWIGECPGCDDCVGPAAVDAREEQRADGSECEVYGNDCLSCGTDAKTSVS